MNEKTIKGQWESYLRILPANASETQIVETRRAFYSGAWVAMNLMQQIGGQSGDDDAGLNWGAGRLESLMQECRAFCDDVRMERA